MGELSEAQKARVKELRQTAQTLLQYADALENGKVTVMRPGSPEARHAFHSGMQPYLAKSEDAPATPVRLTTCTHKLDAVALFLVFAHCPITKDFFVDLERTIMLPDKLKTLLKKCSMGLL
jgi:hypothetical protein